MREKLRRYGKQVMVYICTFVIVAGSVFSFSFISNASSSSVVGQEFTMNYPEPSTGEYQGYVHLLMHNPDSVGSGYYVTTYFWTCFAVSDGKNSPCVMQVTIKENSVEFAPFGASSDADSAFYVISGITNNGTYSMKKYSSTQRYSPSFSNKIVGYKMGGNVLVQTSISNSSVPFTVYYAPDKSTQLLMDVYDILSTMNTQQHLDSHSIWMKLIDVLDECETIEEQLSEVCDLLEDNTESLDALGFRMEQIISQMKEVQNKQIEQIGWLRKIWESIQEFIKGEPQEDSVPEDSENEDMLGSMEETEEALFPDTSQAEQSLNVQLNSGFGVLTWLVENFAQMDSGVYSMFLTMLTFGVIALLLGR